MRAKNKKIRFRDIIIWIIFATNLAAIILLFCSFLSWKISPLKTNLFSYIGLGFGLIFLLNLFYLIFWILISKWKLALISLAAILLCHKPVTTFFPMHLFPDKAPEETVKILTYNVQGFPEERNKNSAEHPILDYIVRTDADIVCLQE
ncbi:MAG: hypothetical protein WCZ46_05190 [Proteiniphilum sp.]